MVDACSSAYAVKALKVADSAIVPEKVAVDTMNPAMLKVADVFIKELGPRSGACLSRGSYMGRYSGE